MYRKKKDSYKQADRQICHTTKETQIFYIKMMKWQNIAGKTQSP